MTCQCALLLFRWLLPWSQVRFCLVLHLGWLARNFNDTNTSEFLYTDSSSVTIWARWEQPIATGKFASQLSSSSWIQTLFHVPSCPSIAVFCCCADIVGLRSAEKAATNSLSPARGFLLEVLGNQECKYSSCFSSSRLFCQLHWTQNFFLTTLHFEGVYCGGSITTVVTKNSRNVFKNVKHVEKKGKYNEYIFLCIYSRNC